MPIHRLTTLASAAALLLFAPAGSAESTWPQWRGPTRDGQVTGKAWPDSLDESHLTQLWRAELGPSYSGPIVAEDRVFVTETIDRKTERATALSRTNGRTLWQAEWPGAMSVPFFARANGDRLLALDKRGDLYLIRLDPEQFELLDSRKLANNSWAHLAVAGEQVFVRDLAGLTVYRWRRP